MSDYVKRQVKDLMSLWANLDSYPVDKLQKLGDRIHQTFNLGGILAFAGNGGSAAEASHLAAEFTGRCVRDHRPLPAINLGESVSAFSATTNDYSFEDSFLRNSQAFLNSKSVVIALSTSGSSPNIVRLIEDATSRGIHTVLWTSAKFVHNSIFDSTEVWIANTNSTPRAQELHLMWGHLLSEYIESSL